MGGMASAAGEDVKIGLGLKDDPERGRPQYRGGDGLTDYQRRTKASVARMQEPSAADKEDDKPAPRRSTMARVAAPTVSSSGVAPVASAPDLPNPDAVGETEQALLDANRKGRSSTIATSPAGLLAGDDSTTKRRSLIGSLIR